MIVSSVQAQPEMVRDLPPPSTITPRYVPTAKAPPVVMPPAPATPVTAPAAAPVTPSAAAATTPPPVVPLPVIPPPAGLPAVPLVPAFGTDAPVMPTPVSLEPKDTKVDPKTMQRLPEPVGNEPTIESGAYPELPGPQKLFRRVSEKDFFERIAQDMKRLGSTSKAIFPDEPIISKEPFQPRVFPRVVKEVEPCYVCHRRLYFEQPNFERTGYDFGILQPALCVGAFYYDLVLLPYHFWSNPQDRTECSVGKCLPGDQAPFRVPCERFSITGLLGMTGTATGIGLLLP